MIRTCLFAMSAAWVVLATPVISAQETPGVSARDLSKYRECQLGMSPWSPSPNRQTSVLRRV
jgi:Na+-translocating ferredoxin:NAD+ oxidoreductase RnfG subunit